MLSQGGILHADIQLEVSGIRELVGIADWTGSEEFVELNEGNRNFSCESIDGVVLWV